MANCVFELHSWLFRPSRFLFWKEKKINSWTYFIFVFVYLNCHLYFHSHFVSSFSFVIKKNSLQNLTYHLPCIVWILIIISFFISRSIPTWLFSYPELSTSQTSKFFSRCHTWNELHLRGQNYRRILRWSRGWLSTFPCLRSSLGVWGKRRFLSHRQSQNFRNMNRNIESWGVVWVVEGSRVVAKGGLKSPY